MLNGDHDRGDWALVAGGQVVRELSDEGELVADLYSQVSNLALSEVLRGNAPYDNICLHLRHHHRVAANPLLRGAGLCHGECIFKEVDVAPSLGQIGLRWRFAGASEDVTRRGTIDIPHDSVAINQVRCGSRRFRFLCLSLRE